MKTTTPPFPEMASPRETQSTEVDSKRNEPMPVIPDHTLIKQIGEGGFGEVWLGRTVMGTYRAIKLVHGNRFGDRRPLEQEFKGLQLFETVCLAHPGLVVLLHAGIDEAAGYFYYVMEAADDLEKGTSIDPSTYTARTLRRALQGGSRFPVSDCLDIGVRLASALMCLQQSELIHRDIKPSNIIFVNGQPKFADPGLVCRIGDPARAAGTVHYCPPEGPGGATTDIYGLGRVLYEVATGMPQKRFPELPMDRLGEGDVGTMMQLNEIIMKACAQNPEERYSGADEMLTDLRQAQKDQHDRPKAAQLMADAVEAGLGMAHRPKRIAILGKSNADPDAEVMDYLRVELAGRDYQVFVDKSLAIEPAWVERIQEQIRAADVAVVLISERSVLSEMVAFQVELAEEQGQVGAQAPSLIPVMLRQCDALPEPFGRVAQARGGLVWNRTADNPTLLNHLLTAIEQGTMPSSSSSRPRPAVEITGGAVSLDSPFYIERDTDREFIQAIERGDSIVLVKGARQVGKTSLLARGLNAGRKAGATVVLTDFQKLDAQHLSSLEALFMKLGDFLADQLDLDVLPGEVWDERRGPNMNFERYLRREVFPRVPNKLVWGLDEMDRLFGCSFASGVFGLLRSWHNERALDPSGPWSKLTLAIAYATEAHLFIRDLNQSPFNVGTRLKLDDFSLEQVADLNRRHGSPLEEQRQLPRLQDLVGGQPYLVRMALNALCQPGSDFDEFVAKADCEEGIFGDHLRRILMLLSKDPELSQVVEKILLGEPCRDATSFYRLRSAGLMTGLTPEQARPRCQIYESYLKRRLLG